MRWPPWRQRARCSMRPGRRPHTTVGKRPGRRRLWLPPLRTRRPFPHRCGRFGGTSMFCRTTRRCVFSTKRCCTTTLPLPSFQPTCWPGCSDSRPPAGWKKKGQKGQKKNKHTQKKTHPPHPPPTPPPRPGSNTRADRANNAPARDRTLAGTVGASRPGAGSQPVALWQQLEAVASALQAIRAGQSGTAALAAVDTALRPGVQSLLFQVLRQAGRAEALRRQMVARTPPPAADALLCTALALCWNPEESPYEPFTLVNQVVEAAKRSASTRAQASFLNGCLRRFLREREALVARTDGDPLARWNHPVWWVERLRKD